MAGRYQLRTLYAERGGVATHEGVDPLTGLPVLVYRFSGDPKPGLRDLESENIPGLLGVDTTDTTDDKTEVVVAYFKEYRPLEKPLSVPATTLLLDSARALKDAAQAGVVHDDIYPGRFLASRDHVLLEGFGVPWDVQEDAYRAPEGEASFAGDVYALAKSVLELAGDTLDGPSKALLRSCLAPDPNERPAASELYASLKTASLKPKGAEATKGAERKPVMPAFDDAELTFTAEPVPDEVPTEPAFGVNDTPPDEASASDLSYEPSQTTRPATPPESQDWDHRWDDIEAGPELILSDPGDRYKANTAASATTKATAKPEGKPFVKDLPPGATYRSGEANTGLRPGLIQEYSFDVQPSADPRRRRLIVMLLLLIAGAAVLAYLALFWQQRQAAGSAAPSSAAGTAYIVDATLGPPDLPPIDIYVVSSPQGSRNPPGALITVVSPPGRQIALDRAGTWQLQARFQNRASEIVTFQVPQERSISFTIPPAPTTTPSQP